MTIQLRQLLLRTTWASRRRLLLFETGGNQEWPIKNTCDEPRRQVVVVRDRLEINMRVRWGRRRSEGKLCGWILSPQTLSPTNVKRAMRWMSPSLRRHSFYHRQISSLQIRQTYLSQALKNRVLRGKRSLLGRLRFDIGIHMILLMYSALHQSRRRLQASRTEWRRVPSLVKTIANWNIWRDARVSLRWGHPGPRPCF